MSRILLTSTLTIYADAASGLDTNSGLAAAAPVKTLNRAWEILSREYDLQGYSAVIQLAAGVYTSMATNVGCVGQGGYDGVIIQGQGPNDTTTIIDGSGSDAIQAGASSSGGVQFVVQNLTIRSAVASGISVFGSGNGVIARNVTWGYCAGAHTVCAHGAEAAEQGYILCLGGGACHAQAVTSGRFTSDGITLAIGTGLTWTLAAYFCTHGEMNIGGMSVVNPVLANGPYKVAVKCNGVILSGGGQMPNPGGAVQQVQGGLFT
jgi:hypothetical protein